MDNRRGFFGKLLGLVGVAAFPIETKAVEENGIFVPKNAFNDPFIFPGTNEFRYKQFWIYWTGWKKAVNFDFEAGQWLAYEGGPKNSSTGRRFYASYPGDEREFYIGQCFDISVKEHQIPVSHYTEEKDKSRCQLQCLQRLMALIEEQPQRKMIGRGRG